MALFIPPSGQSRGIAAPINPKVGDTWEEVIGNSSFRWYWSGLYWLSQQVLEFKYSSASNVVTLPQESVLPSSNLFLLRLIVNSNPQTPHNTTNYRSLTLSRVQAGGFSTALSSINMANDPVNTWTYREVILDTHINASATFTRFLNFTFPLVGSPGVSAVTATLKYRLARA